MFYVFRCIQSLSACIPQVLCVFAVWKEVCAELGILTEAKSARYTSLYLAEQRATGFFAALTIASGSKDRKQQLSRSVCTGKSWHRVRDEQELRGKSETGTKQVAPSPQDTMELLRYLQSTPRSPCVAHLLGLLLPCGARRRMHACLLTHRKTCKRCYWITLCPHQTYTSLLVATASTCCRIAACGVACMLACSWACLFVTASPRCPSGLYWRRYSFMASSPLTAGDFDTSLVSKHYHPPDVPQLIPHKISS